MEALDSDAGEQNDVLQTLFKEETQIPELVRTVLLQVQSEFTNWNIAYCRRVLASFTSPANWQSYSHLDLRSPNSTSVTATCGDSSRSDETETVFQQLYSPTGTVIETASVKLDVIHLSSPLEPHPQYESCSPLHRNMFKGDDSDDMNFIPYADDPTFDQTGHTHHYGSFSWLDTFDPDLEMIVLEAVYRLQVQHALTYDEIEDSNVLPLKLYSRPDKCGVLSTARKRDLFNWAGRTIPSSYIFPSPTSRPGGSNFRHRLRMLNSVFCPNLNCIEPLCGLHFEPNPMPLGSQPSSLHDHDRVTNPCRNQCFLSKVEQDSPSWDEADLDMFKIITEISPNTTTCDLAELCLKPCHEVFYYRKLLYSNDPVEAQPVDIKSQRRLLRFNDSNPTRFTPNDPCCHDGPCNISSGCPCFENRSYCQRNCRCPPECARRWKGCRCAKTKPKGSCATERCPCVEAFRECDPELCTNCRCMCKFACFCLYIMFSMILADDTLCRNSQIQRGARKALEVKKSAWGLGTFLVEGAKAGDLITEYVGELIYEPTVDSRADLAEHRKRCYVFGLNSTLSLDSTYVGDVSRFINHSDTERVNSHAQVRLVNGDHRIGIFAVRDMEEATEILMNYGSQFFIK